MIVVIIPPGLFFHNLKATLIDAIRGGCGAKPPKPVIVPLHPQKSDKTVLKRTKLSRMCI